MGLFAACTRKSAHKPMGNNSAPWASTLLELCAHLSTIDLLFKSLLSNPLRHVSRAAHAAREWHVSNGTRAAPNGTRAARERQARDARAADERPATGTGATCQRRQIGTITDKRSGHRETPDTEGSPGRYSRRMRPAEDETLLRQTNRRASRAFTQRPTPRSTRQPCHDVQTPRDIWRSIGQICGTTRLSGEFPVSETCSKRDPRRHSSQHGGASKDSGTTIENCLAGSLWPAGRLRRTAGDLSQAAWNHFGCVTASSSRVQQILNKWRSKLWKRSTWPPSIAKKRSKPALSPPGAPHRRTPCNHAASACHIPQSCRSRRRRQRRRTRGGDRSANAAHAEAPTMSQAAVEADAHHAVEVELRRPAEKDRPQVAAPVRPGGHRRRARRHRPPRLQTHTGGCRVCFTHSAPRGRKLPRAPSAA